DTLATILEEPVVGDWRRGEEWIFGWCAPERSCGKALRDRSVQQAVRRDERTRACPVHVENRQRTQQSSKEHSSEVPRPGSLGRRRLTGSHPSCDSADEAGFVSAPRRLSTSGR